MVASVGKDVIETCLIVGREGAEREVALRGPSKGGIEERNEARTEQRPLVTVMLRNTRTTIERRVWKRVPVPDKEITSGKRERRLQREFVEKAAASGNGGESVDVDDF